MEHFLGNLNSFIMILPGEHIARKWEAIFGPLSQIPLFAKPPLRACSPTRDRSLNRSLHLLSPLVFTVTAFEISLFQGPERQYQSSEKVQVSKIFQALAPHPQNPQLNDSLASLVQGRFATRKRAHRFQILIPHPTNPLKPHNYCSTKHFYTANLKNASLVFAFSKVTGFRPATLPKIPIQFVCLVFWKIKTTHHYHLKLIRELILVVAHVL